jgi:Tol biopolymer transport system component
MGIEAGIRLGPYEVVEAIGAGGMGEVYRARDPRMDRFVAIKILPPMFSQHPERLRRFELEARAAGSINHPNLVTVFDAGMHRDTPYIVMEFLEGETLRAKIGRYQVGPAVGGRGLSSSRLSIRKATDYAVQIANGLAAAHERGIVHRDLKPENILVTRDGRVKILDFGLAKQMSLSDEKTELGQTETQETTPGAILGTVGYMSPEQVRGQQVDHRTDIFSLGAILYEMLTGERAFHGPSAADTMSAILHAHPADSETAAEEVSPALRRIVIRSLEKNREERFQSARDLAFALEAVATSSGSSDVRATKRPGLRKRFVIALLIVLIVFIAGMTVAWFLRSRAAAPAATWHLRQLTFESGLESEPSVFPDGQAFVFTCDRNGNRDIYFQRVDGGNPIDLTGDSVADDFEPAISPDGQQIAFRSERDGGGIFLMGATGESVRRLTRAGFNPCWSPDGRTIVFATEDIQSPLARMSVSQLWTVDVASGATTKISSGDAVQPKWSPDGARIVYWAVQRPGSKRSLFTIPAAGGKATQLNDDRFVNWSPAWSPDGKSIIYSSDRGGSTNLWRIDLDADGRAISQPIAITNSPQVNIAPAFSRDGSRLLFSSYTDEARLMRVALDPVTGRFTSQPQRVVGGSRAIYNADISPDGSMLVTNTYGRQEDLFIGKIGGAAGGAITRQLTNDAFKDRLPRWSPDGSRIVFFSDRKGNYDIWWIRPDGSGLQQVSASGAEGFLEPRWSSDGKKIVAYTTLALRPATFDVTGALPAKPQFLPELPKQTGTFYVNSWSRDGKRLAGTIVRPDGSMNGIATFSFDSNRYDIVAETGAYPQWLGDSRTLLFGLDTQYLIDADTKVVRAIGRLPGIDPAFRFLPDTHSNNVYYASRPAEGDIWMLERDR